jgi:hypothetical protein
MAGDQISANNVALQARRLQSHSKRRRIAQVKR